MMASASEAHSRPSAGVSPLRFALARKNLSSTFVFGPSSRLRLRRVIGLLATGGLLSATARPLLASLAEDREIFDSVVVSVPFAGIAHCLPFLRTLATQSRDARLPSV